MARSVHAGMRVAHDDSASLRCHATSALAPGTRALIGRWAADDLSLTPYWWKWRRRRIRRMRIVEPWAVGQRAAVWMACGIAAPVRPNRPTWLPGKRIPHPDLVGRCGIPRYCGFICQYRFIRLTGIDELLSPRMELRRIRPASTPETICAESGGYGFETNPASPVALRSSRSFMPPTRACRRPHVLAIMLQRSERVAPWL